jgi:hypothetical protein
MKYCSPCRLKAKDDDEKCSRCRGTLRLMGGPGGQQRGSRTRQSTASTASAKPARSTMSPPNRSPATAPAPPPATAPEPSVKKPAAPQSSRSQPSKPSGTPDFQFQLAGLQTAAQSTSRRVRLLAVLAGVLAIGFAGLLFYLRHNYIMQFAEVAQLEIVRSDLHTGTALIHFRPLTKGRIQFVREGGSRQETLLEHSSGPTPEGEFKEFHWTGVWSTRTGSRLPRRPPAWAFSPPNNTGACPKELPE